MSYYKTFYECEMNGKKRCSVYVRNSELGPSDYYRIIQYVSYLDQYVCFKINNALNSRDFQKNIDMKGGIIKSLFQILLYIKILINRIRDIWADIKQKPDIIIVQREIFPKYMPFFLKKTLYCLFKDVNLIWDFDDDIFLNGEISCREKNILGKYSSHIIGIGNYAKKLLDPNYQNKYLMLPTTDCCFDEENIEKIQEKRYAYYSSEIRIIWVGTASTLFHLDLVMNEVAEAASVLKKMGKKLVFCIVCNVPYLKEFKDLYIENVKWSRENAKNEIKKAHIGIMPLVDQPYVQGKGGFKLIQYLASGMPVIASNIGFCKEVVSKECGFLIDTKEIQDWTKRIMELSSNHKMWKELGQGAYRRYCNNFSFKKNLEVWKTLIQ